MVLSAVNFLLLGLRYCGVQSEARQGQLREEGTDRRAVGSSWRPGSRRAGRRQWRAAFHHGFGLRARFVLVWIVI